MDRLLSLGEACDIMRVSYSKGQRLAKAGRLPFGKLGATWTIPRSVLLEALGMRQDDDPDETTDPQQETRAIHGGTGQRTNAHTQ